MDYQSFLLWQGLDEDNALQASEAPKRADAKARPDANVKEHEAEIVTAELTPDEVQALKCSARRAHQERPAVRNREQLRGGKKKSGDYRA